MVYFLAISARLLYTVSRNARKCLALNTLPMTGFLRPKQKTTELSSVVFCCAWLLFAGMRLVRVAYLNIKNEPEALACTRGYIWKIRYELPVIDFIEIETALWYGFTAANLSYPCLQRFRTSVNLESFYFNKSTH